MSCVLRIKQKNTYVKIYYFLWAIYSFTYIFMMNSEYRYMCSNVADIFYTIEKCLALMILLLFTVQLKITKRRTVIYSVILLIAVVSFMSIKEVDFIALLCFLLPLYKIDISEFLLFDIKIRLIILFFIISLCLLGVFPNYTDTINGTYKQAFGFAHPNSLSAYVISILVEWVTIRYNRLKIYDYMGILFALVIIWNVAASRSSVYVFLLFFVFTFLSKSFPILLRNRILQNIICTISLIMAALSFIAIWLYSNKNAITLAMDEVFSRRIKAAYRAFSVYGISIFGQNMETYGARTIENSTQLYSVDMGYVYIAMHYGIIVLILVLLVYYIAAKKLIERKQYGMVLAIMYYAINGIAETHITRIQFNFSLIIIFGTVIQGTTRYLKSREPIAMRSVNSRMNF